MLALYSNASPEWMQRAVREAAAALPHGEVEGHDGTFHTLPPDTLAAVLKAYFVGAS